MDLALWPIALGSTLAWASFDAIRKGLVARMPVLSLSLWVCVVQVPGYLLWVAIEGGWSLNSGYWAPALGSMVVNLLANLLFLEAVRIAPLSTVIPILSLTPVFVALKGIPLLGEFLSLPQWLGVALVSGGALWLTAPAETRGRPLSTLRSFFRERGVVYMVGVSMMWALTPILDKLALRHTTVGVHALLLATGVGLGMLVVITLRGQLGTLAVPRAARGLLLTGGVANVAAMGLQLVAVSVMVVSVFEAFKRAVGLMLSMALGAAVFGERVSRTKVAAGAVMAAGVLLVLLGD